MEIGSACMLETGTRFNHWCRFKKYFKCFKCLVASIKIILLVLLLDLDLDMGFSAEIHS